jgi:cytochrome b pre-mRNA-processing protein 3
MIVAQAREPVFYQALNVPDTVNARFDMVVVHLWLVLRRLRELEPEGVTAQGLFDHFCADMDANLREMGVGDLTVPKRMQKFGEAFYGRTAAYDTASSAGEAAMAEVLARNVLNSADPAKAGGLAAYVTAAMARLAGIEGQVVRAGDWQFPKPQVAS